MNPKAILNLFKDTFKDWSEDKASRLGAALAYYTVFSIGPLLLIAISIAGLVFGQSKAQNQIIGTIRNVIGGSGADMLIQAVQHASKPSTSIIATIIGVVTLIFGASGVFGQLKDALNTIWEVTPKKGLDVAERVKEHALPFTMVLGTGFLLLVSLIMNAILSALGTWLSNLLPGGDILWQGANYLIAFAIVTLMFALMFKYLPDVLVAWKDVWIGAAITTLLFLVGQAALGVYLGMGSVGSAYGAAGSLVVLLVWVYYSAQIFFFGAEFTQVYARKYGSRVQPAEDAEFVTDEARAQQGLTRHDQGAADKTVDTTKEERRGRGSRRLTRSPWFR